MKKINDNRLKKILVFSVLMSVIPLFSQGINIFIPEGYGLDNNSRNIVSNKLKQLSSQNGFSIEETRFIVSAKIDILSKELIQSAEPYINCELGVSFYIGDGIKGRSFESYYTEVSGSGARNNIALRNALKNIRPNQELNQFFQKGKQKIAEYYAQNCDLIIQEAQSDAEMGYTRSAIRMLSDIPKSEKKCWKKANTIAVSLYKKDIELDCEQKYSEAKGIWYARKTKYGAIKATELLSKIDPSAEKCFAKVQILHNEISREISNDKSQVIQLQNKQMNNEIMLSKKMLDTYKAVEIAKARRKPVQQHITYKSLF